MAKKNNSLLHFLGVLVVIVCILALLYALYSSLSPSTSNKREGLDNRLGDYQSLVGGQGPKPVLPWKKMPKGFLCDPPLGKGIARNVKSEAECLAAFRKQYGSHAETGTLTYYSPVKDYKNNCVYTNSATCTKLGICKAHDGTTLPDCSTKGVYAYHLKNTPIILPIPPDTKSAVASLINS
tara:strand:- start:825 stop:1367 length:543 start_codon:yes stop_codon:yes gene_type:complete